MKRLFISLSLALTLIMTIRAEVVFNEEHTVGNWTDYQTLLLSDYPVWQNASAGDVIAINVTAITAGQTASVTLQYVGTDNWYQLGDCSLYDAKAGRVCFALTDETAAIVKEKGIIVTGAYYTFDKVELLYRKSLWTGTLSDNSGWQVVQLPSATFADLVSGSLLGVNVSAVNNGAEWHQYTFGVNWRSDVLVSGAVAANTYIHALTDAQIDSLVNQPVITLAAQYLDVSELYTYVSAKGTAHAGENQTIWTGEKVFASSWSVWEQLPASVFADAVEGQLLRLKFKNLGAGAQLKVSKGDWNDMPDWENNGVTNISGVYQDYTITADVLSALKAGGAIISGTNYTLTSVWLIDPASLKTLVLSVPVTDNWIFSAKPTITIHVENPYNEAVTANAEIQISTDKMDYITTLSSSVEIPANGSDNIVLTADNTLSAGFYKATCTVNDDLARAFVFGINPEAIVSATDAQSDFASFWAAAKSQLEAVDMNAALTELPAKSTAARKVYLVEFNSVPDGLTGTPVVVRGYYAEPQDGKKHPVIMHYMGYDSGYRPGGQDVKPYCPSGDAEPDYAEFYLSTRGQSINNRAASEREADGKGDFTNTYGDWFAFNFGDKDSYYYRGAFMDCVQAIRFMATRTTSDMNNLFAEGQSQGGAFTYAAAALSGYPFRAIAPGIAFLGDYPDYFSIVNWPAYVARENQGTMTDAQMYAFLSYFDTKNLAASVSAATLACIGLQDNVCPPHTNIAPYNNLLSTDKQLLFNPELGHQAASSWYSDMMNFFAAHIDNTTTAVDEIADNWRFDCKYIIDGQLLISRGDNTYNILGQLQNFKR